MGTENSSGSGQAEQFAWPFFPEENVVPPAAADPAVVAAALETRSDLQHVDVVPDALVSAASSVDTLRSTVGDTGRITAFLDGELAYEWHDGVALVQQLAEQCLASGIRGSLPPPHDITLEADGRLRVALDPAGTESTVRGLGHVLNQLLSGRPAPAALRLIGSQAVSQPTTIESISDLMRALAPFERPNRLEKLAALHARASAADAWSRPVPSPTAPAPEPREPEPTVATAEAAATTNSAPSTFPVIHPREMTLAALAILAGVVLVVVTWTIRSVVSSADRPSPTLTLAVTEPTRPPATEPNQTEALTIEASSPSPAPSSVRSSVPPPTTTPPPANQRLASRTDQPRSEGRAATASRPGTTVIQPAVQPSIASSAPPASVANPRADRAANSGVSIVTDGVEDRVYSVDDFGVVEPVLMRPYIPQLPPGASPDRAQGVLDLIIDKDGLVESVRLISPANRYRERWWVSVAKNWQFRPAFKDGQPVRFRKRMVITDFPEPVK